MKHKLVVYHLFWSAVILTTIKFYQAEEIENVETLWEEFKLVNAKAYGNLEEEFNRYKIWVSNYYYVQEHNKNVQSSGNGFTLGLNSFCDMSQEEVAKFKHGLKMNKPSVKKLLKSSSTSNFRGYLGFKLDLGSDNKSIPDSMSKFFKDWVTSGVVSSIKDQGLCGACWSFVSTGALESHLKIRQLSSKLSTLSEQQLIDCSVSYGNEGCDGGLMSQAFEYVKDNKGIYSDSVYAYVGSLNSCKKLKSDMFGPVHGYVSLPIDENVIKEAVARIGPIAIGIDADHKSFTLYKGGIYFEPLCSSENLNHAVLIVGYGQEKGQDYWLIKNSWGTSWGENGFGRIARNKNNHCGIATLAGYPILE